MIDDQAQVEALMQEMEAALPIPAEVTSQLRRGLRAQGAFLPTRNVTIKRVFYGGDEGGIMCDITPSQETKEGFVTSLTHLRIPFYHPLSKDIRAYQRVRKTRLAEQDGV